MDVSATDAEDAALVQEFVHDAIDVEQRLAVAADQVDAWFGTRANVQAWVQPGDAFAGQRELLSRAQTTAATCQAADIEVNRVYSECGVGGEIELAQVAILVRLGDGCASSIDPQIAQQVIVPADRQLAAKRAGAIHVGLDRKGRTRRRRKPGSIDLRRRIGRGMQRA